MVPIDEPSSSPTVAWAGRPGRPQRGRRAAPSLDVHADADLLSVTHRDPDPIALLRRPDRDLEPDNAGRHARPVPADHAPGAPVLALSVASAPPAGSAPLTVTADIPDTVLVPARRTRRPPGTAAGPERIHSTAVRTSPPPGPPGPPGPRLSPIPPIPPIGQTPPNPPIGQTPPNPLIGPTPPNPPIGQTPPNPPIGQTPPIPPIGQTPPNPPTPTTRSALVTRSPRAVPAPPGGPARRGGRTAAPTRRAIRPGVRPGAQPAAVTAATAGATTRPRGSHHRPVPLPGADGRHRPDIEGLRGLAVLLVVAGHAGVPGLSGGFVGVDVFFVLSGFLITGLLLDEARDTGAVSVVGFYARRARRLLPAAALVLVTTCVVFRWVLAPIDRPDLRGDALAAALWSSNWRFAALSTQYLSPAASSPVLHLWSLGVEEQFYLLAPLFAIAALGRRHAGGRRSRGGPSLRPWPVTEARLTVGLIAVTTVSLLASSATTGPWAYFGTHTRAWELAGGGLLATARPALRTGSTVLLVLGGWLGLLLVIWSAVAYGPQTSFPGTAALLPVGGCLLLLAAGSRSSLGPAALLSRPWITALGRVSYAWYLWHWPALALVAHLAGTPSGTGDGTVSVPAAVSAAAVVVSLGLAVATHRLIEQPVRRHPVLVASPRASLGLGAALVTLMVITPAVLLSGGAAPGSASGGVRAPVVEAGAAGGAGSGARPGADPGTAGGQPNAAGSSVRVAAAALTEFGTVGAPVDAPAATAPVMSPDQARADDVEPAQCMVGFAATTAAPCRFGDPAGRLVVVLFGDSHAAQWFAALQRIALTRGWQLYFWAKSACGYADVPQWLAPYQREYTECAAWRSAVLRRIGALPRVDAILVSRNANQLAKVADEGQPVTDSAAAAALWAQGAARTLARLAQRAHALTLIRDTPQPGGDVPACLSAHPGSPLSCAYPRDGAIEPDGPLLQVEQAALLAVGATVVRVAGLICSTAPCPVVSPRGTVEFRDGSHLTGTFARELAPALTPLLLAALRLR